MSGRRPLSWQRCYQVCGHRTRALCLFWALMTPAKHRTCDRGLEKRNSIRYRGSLKHDVPRRRAGTMKKPGWWTGWWLLKSVLIWFAVFLVWFPVFSRRPDSVPAKILTFLFVLCMLPLLLSYAIGVIGDVLRFFVPSAKARRKSLEQTDNSKDNSI